MKKLFSILLILLWAFPVFATCNFNIIIAGQSNGGQMTCDYYVGMLPFTDGCNTSLANTGVYMWNGSAWVSPGTNSGNDSAGLVALGNTINNTTGCMVHMVDISFGSSSIFQVDQGGEGWWWNTNGTPSTNAQDGANWSYASQKAIVEAATGGVADAVVLMNGECEGLYISPVNSGATQSWYATNYTAFWNQLHSDYGNAIFIQSQLATCTSCTHSANTDASWSSLREWNKTFVSSYGSNAYIGDCTVNFTLGNSNGATGIHWTAAGYAQAGAEIAQTFLYAKGYVSWYQGPVITGLNAVDSNVTDIVINYRDNATNFTPTTGIGGFALTCGGTAVTINSAVQETTNAIRLNHGVCTGTRIATYMYGLAPLTFGTGNAGTPVTDNSTLSYALEPNINITQIGITYTISGTVSGAVQSGVTINLTGTSTASTTTGNGGTYSFSGLAAGSYWVSPNLAGYAFSPTTLSPIITTANISGENFTDSTVVVNQFINAGVVGRFSGTVQ